MRDTSGIITRRMTPDEQAAFGPPRRFKSHRRVSSEHIRRARIDATRVGTPSAKPSTWKRK